MDEEPRRAYSMKDTTDKANHHTVSGREFINREEANFGEGFGVKSFGAIFDVASACGVEKLKNSSADYIPSVAVSSLLHKRILQRCFGNTEKYTKRGTERGSKHVNKGSCS